MKKLSELMLTQERLKEVLTYGPETGVFLNRIKRSWRSPAGSVAGCIYRGKWGSYWVVRVDMKMYFAHRLAWLYMVGRWPKEHIDHINGNGIDNRMCNLREATNFENAQNISSKARAASGYVGVRWSPGSKKWYASIGTNYKNKFIGLFDNPADAHAAYLSEKARIHTFNPTLRSEQ